MTYRGGRDQHWSIPYCLPGLKVQTALLILRLSNINYGLGESVLSGLWLRRRLATRCKKILEKKCFSLHIHCQSLLERGLMDSLTAKKPLYVQTYLLLMWSSNSSIINILLAATNTPGSLGCKYFAKAVVMKLTTSAGRRLEISHKAPYVQKYSRWKRNQPKSTATANVSVPRTILFFFYK